jgi:octaprenyl-diphosphate synthase
MSSTAFATTPATPTDELGTIRAPVASDLAGVDVLIAERLHSDVVLVNQIAQHIIHSGGKRLRPLVTLLAARAAGHADGREHVRLAAIVEFIHTATLLHDDVVDDSKLRRGELTANALFGNEASVLVGDFLYSRAFQMMVDVGSLEVMSVLADTTNAIAEGEVLQLLNCHDPDTSEERYVTVINAKTARLFAAAARIGAMVAGAETSVQEGLARYGQHLGVAYQLVDDVLDYRGSAEEIGKNVGDDLSEGKPTLPLIEAIRRASGDERTVLREAIEHGGLARIEQVVTAVERTGAIDYTARRAAEEAAAASASLAALPPSPFRDSLTSLAEFAIKRTY